MHVAVRDGRHRRNRRAKIEEFRRHLDVWRRVEKRRREWPAAFMYSRPAEVPTAGKYIFPRRVDWLAFAMIDAARQIPQVAIEDVQFLR